MDPWSKVGYSRFIREASMVVEKLPELVPPSGRVTGRGLLVLPILEARRRRNRGEIVKKGSVIKGFRTRGIYRRRGQPEVDQGALAPPWCSLGVAAPGGRLGHPWLPSGPTWALPEASCTLIF